MQSSKLSKPILAAFAFAMIGATGAPSAIAEMSALFAEYDETSSATVDSAPYTEIIAALSVEDKGRTLIAYDVAHSRALPFFEQYVLYLSNIPVERLNRDEQLAYWLNTRNVLLVQALSEERRVFGYKSKRGTPDEPGAFWNEKRITVSGIFLSLHEIERDILLAGWDDPNLIYGLYQGNRGGPALARLPFNGADVHAQLAEAGRRFTASTNNFRVRGDEVRISTYYDWYLNAAFGGDETLLRQHLSSFATPDQAPLVNGDGKLKRRGMSRDLEQYQTRQANTGFSNSGTRSGGGFGS